MLLARTSVPLWQGCASNEHRLLAEEAFRECRKGQKKEAGPEEGWVACPNDLGVHGQE
jgi:hypothetical protein